MYLHEETGKLIPSEAGGCPAQHFSHAEQPGLPGPIWPALEEKKKIDEKFQDKE